MSIGEIVLTVLWVLMAGAFGWFGFHLAMLNGRLLIRIEGLEAFLAAQQGTIGLPPGTAVDNFSLPLLTGKAVTLSEFRGRKLALIFTRLGCQQSEQMLRQLSQIVIKRPALIPLIVSAGDMAANQRFFTDQPISCPVFCDEQGTVAKSYRVSSTPMAFVVDEGGATVGNLLVGPAAILDLFRAGTAQGEPPSKEAAQAASLSRSKIRRDGLKAGTKAPDFHLSTIADGSEISLAELRGRQTLLVFSDPDCGPCKALAPDLEQIHRKMPELQVLMISRGDRDVNLRKATESGLTFPVALQAHWEVSRAYGTFATPSGYLVDEHGVLAKDVAIGKDEILRLAADRQSLGDRREPEEKVPAALNT